MQKVKILDVRQSTKKSGEVFYNMVVLGEFSAYGEIKPSTVDVRLTSEQFAYYLPKLNKDVEIDVIIPLPSFPLTLAETDKSNAQTRSQS